MGVKVVKNYPCLIETIHIYKMNWVFSWVQWINTLSSARLIFMSIRRILGVIRSLCRTKTGGKYTNLAFFLGKKDPDKF